MTPRLTPEEMVKTLDFANAVACKKCGIIVEPEIRRLAEAFVDAKEELNEWKALDQERNLHTQSLAKENQRLWAELEELRDAFRKVESEIVDVCENFGRSNYQYCNDESYGGKVATKDYFSLKRALEMCRSKSQGSRVGKLVSALENSCDCVRGLVCPACEALKEWNS